MGIGLTAIAAIIQPWWEIDAFSSPCLLKGYPIIGFKSSILGIEWFKKGHSHIDTLTTVFATHLQH